MASTLPGMFGQQDQQKTAQNSGIYSPELDWNTFNQNILQPYVTSGSWGDPNNQRGSWVSQLGLDPGGRYSVGIKGLDRDSFFRGAMNPNLDDMGLPTYQSNPNGQADWEAAVQKAIADPNSIFSLDMDRINPGGTTQGGNTRSTVEYRLQNGKLVPVSQNNTTNNSWNSNFGEMAGLFAAAVGAGNMLNSGGIGGAGSGGLSGMDLAADAALGTGNNIATAGSMFDAAGGLAGTGIPQFAQQPGYGQQVGGALADASGASPMTGAVNSAATNPALIDSALQTPGYGVSSAGIGGGPGTGLAGVIGDAVNGLKQIPGVSKVGGNIVSNLLGSVLGGGSGGVSTLGNLGSLFTNYNQYSNNKDLINEIKGIYSPDGAYAKSLGEQLARKDAAAGRNSQYGPRLADLMGRLGDSQARALSGLGGFMQNQQGGLNGMVGAGSRLFDSMGGMNALAKLFQGSGEQLTNDWALGPNGGPQMPLEDPDNWDLFGG